ncbi:MAG: beta-galactosidase, partial [Acetobacteraceae bacterium]
MKLLFICASLLLLTATARAASPWPDYQILEWQPRTPQQLATLKSIGVTGGMAPINREAGTFDPNLSSTAAMRAAGMRYYIENTATDFYSAYHRWMPNHPIGARFAALQARYKADPSDLSVFIRDPGLSDPAWLTRIADRLTAMVNAARADHPVYYSLGDETGIAELAAPWDFDLSPSSLAGFRAWLQSQYSDLTALNAEWGTRYTDWDQVKPELTDATLSRTDGNYAAWSDFKAWMDVAFARAVRAGTDAVHRADPSALAAIEGAQVPGWGGYDYTRLAGTVDVMEIYDTYQNLPIVHSLNPSLVPLTTAFGGDPQQLHAIWRELLRGARGVVLWDDQNRIVDKNGRLGPAGERYAPVFSMLRGTPGQAVLASKTAYDPVAILYSPPSFRVQWLLDQHADRTTWVTRSLDQDDVGNAQRVGLAQFGNSLAHLGITPRYIGPDQLAGDALTRFKVLILPHVIALSGAEADAIRGFVAQGGRLIADVSSGGFDAHGKRDTATSLADLFDGSRVAIVPPADRSALRATLARDDVVPAFSTSTDDVQCFVFDDGARTIVAVQRDFARHAATEHVMLTLPHPMNVTDLMSAHALGQMT